ncbi:hypothetical protein ACOME3_009701 [Neoechinorhynchus agilis]
MAPFPLIKLGAIFAKQISKPIANMVKDKATRSPQFRKYACIGPAQFYHWIDVKVRMRALGLHKGFERDGKVKPLSEEAAVQLSADLLGESVVLLIAVLTLYLEYSRRSRNEAEKVDETDKIFRRLESHMVRLLSDVNQIDKRLCDLESRS